MSEIFRSHVKTARPSEVGQPRPGMRFARLIVVGKYGVQNVSGQLLERRVPANSARLTCRSPTDREAAILMEGHASPVSQRYELADREALVACFIETLRPEIAERAKSYDATRRDRGQIDPIVNEVGVRLPAYLRHH